MINNRNGVEAQGAGNASQNLAIVTFKNEMFGSIRTAGTPDEPQFCLADICMALDLTPSKVVQRLDKDVLSKYPLSTAGGVQNANFVNEDGLYDVILDSRKPEAKAFRKWITAEVLPQIRRTGGYIPVSEQDDEKTILAKALSIMQRTLEQKDRLLESKSNTIAKYNALTEEARNSTLHYTVGDVAKELGYKTAGALYKALEDKGYVKKIGKRKWMPTDKLPSKYYHIEPYTYTKHGIEYEGCTFHLTEAFVVAMRAKRMKKKYN